MRVLHVIPSLAAVHGGPSVALRRMAAALTDRGVTVDVATTDDEGPGLHGRVMVEGCRVFQFRKQTEFYKLSWPLLRWLRQHVRDYDLLHIHALFSFSSVMAARVARQAGVPYILRPLGTLSPYGMTQRRPLFKRLSLACVEGPLLRDAAAVHFTSSQEAQEAADLGLPLRGVVLPLGLPAAAPGDPQAWRSQLGIAPDEPCAVFLSRLDPKKNLAGLLSAAALLKAQGKAWHWLIGGDGAATHQAELKRMAQQLGLQGCVHWLGRVEGQAKADLLATGDVFVLPSFAENFGIAVAEALAASLPCVVGEGVALSHDIARHGAGVVVGTDAASIAAGVAALMNDPDRRAAAAQAARELADREYSLQTMGQRLVELYQAIVPARGVS